MEVTDYLEMQKDENSSYQTLRYRQVLCREVLCRSKCIYETLTDTRNK